MEPELFDVMDNSPESVLAMNSLVDLLEDITNPISVVLTVNGQQASFRTLVQSVVSSFNQDVEERAKDLVKERTTDKLDGIIKTLQDTKELLLDKLRELGIRNVDDDSEYWYDT